MPGQTWCRLSRTSACSAGCRWTMSSSLSVPTEEMGILDDELDGRVFVGPPGWLAHVAGQLASFRLDGNLVTVRAAALEPAATEAMIDAIRAGFDSEISEGDERFDRGERANPSVEHRSIDDVLWEALVHDPSAFRSGAIPRLDTLLTAAGFERQDHTVARAGFAWVELHRWRTRRRAIGPCPACTFSAARCP